MPMFVLALNLTWEIIYACIATHPLERAGFALWVLVDCPLIYAVLVHGRKYEWAHAPLVQQHLGKIFATMCAGCTLAHLAFIRWWVNNGIGAHRGKTFFSSGADITELAFWSVGVCGAVTSVMCLCQLVVRGHSGGVGFRLWALRASGTVTGCFAYFIWRRVFWPAAHEYVTSPIALVLWTTSFLADCAFPVLLWHVRKTEKALPDGRKIGLPDAGSTPKDASTSRKSKQ
ncbi:hypothetical protein AURDEDRAFT_64125 [Auricularia subglabra TFB-10046 SS5]|nr:hypothetical protein AURDEDRAFT_64125 [Auricularia subglabra TFB-10046 SS5]